MPCYKSPKVVDDGSCLRFLEAGANDTEHNKASKQLRISSDVNRQFKGMNDTF